MRRTRAIPPPMTSLSSLLIVACWRSRLAGRERRIFLLLVICNCPATEALDKS